MPAILRLGRWTPLIWWVMARTIEVMIPQRLGATCVWIGAAGTVLLIIVVETRIGVWQRSRTTAAMP